MYDFHKTRNENNENEFKHKLFLRDWKYVFIHMLDTYCHKLRGNQVMWFQFSSWQ